MQDIVECPNCGKKSVVKRGDNVYECLACDFKRDFSKQPERKAEAGVFFWPTAIAAIIAFLILQVGRYAAQNNPNIEYQSSTPTQVFTE